MHKVIIIGGGIIGGSIAWRLAQAGAAVTLVEAGTLGGEASWAGAGMLAPGWLVVFSQAWRPVFGSGAAGRSGSGLGGRRSRPAGSASALAARIWEKVASRKGELDRAPSPPAANGIRTLRSILVKVGSVSGISLSCGRRPKNHQTMAPKTSAAAPATIHR